MWIKIKSDLYNLANFHTISKNKFKIEVWCVDELLNIHRKNVIENLKELKKYCWRENKCNIGK